MPPAQENMAAYKLIKTLKRRGGVRKVWNVPPVQNRDRLRDGGVQRNARAVLALHYRATIVKPPNPCASE